MNNQIIKKTEYSKRHLKLFGIDFNQRRAYDANQATIIQNSLLLRLRGPFIHRFGRNISEINEKENQTKEKVSDEIKSNYAKLMLNKEV